jgi:acylglycerol lipase
MQHYEFSWKNPMNKKIFAQGWLPDNQTKAVMILIHGMGEHSSRYEHVAEFLCSKGYAVLSCDRVGHGKSEGRRGHVDKYDYLLDDIIKLQSEAEKKFPGTPVILYGHSMGGGLVLNYLIKNPDNGFKAVVASAPALLLAFEPPALKLSLGKIMRGIYPGFTQKNEINPNHLSRDKEIVEKYIQDPLVHNLISAETALGLIEWGKNAIERVKKVAIPVLLMHGDADQLTSHKGTEIFSKNAEGDVTLKIWLDMYHEIHNELEKQSVLDYMLEWMDSKLK